MRLVRPLLAAALVALALVPAHAAGCTSSTPTATVASPRGALYLVVAVDGTEPVSGEPACPDLEHGCVAGLVAYLESNGVGGLQRDDGARDDTADGTCYAPDSKLL